MAPLAWFLHSGTDHAIRAVRQSQALVIAATDKLARDGSDRPRVLGRLWRVNLDVTGIVLGEPADVVDGTYAQVLRLVTLQREFTHRVYEAIDTREPRPTVSDAPSNVIPLEQRSGS